MVLSGANPATGVTRAETECTKAISDKQAVLNVYELPRDAHTRSLTSKLFYMYELPLEAKERSLFEISPLFILRKVVHI